jgi:hypothetical protein
MFRRVVSARLAQEAGQTGNARRAVRIAGLTLTGHAADMPKLEVTANEALDALAAGNRNPPSI